ncbi:MAG: hypothetical protein IV100_32280 [Myxococcales bacterium]|nr:hypothetical protein [Myxococcales bacterium]
MRLRSSRSPLWLLSVTLYGNTGCNEPSAATTTDVVPSIGQDATASTDSGDADDVTTTVLDDTTVIPDVPSLEDVDSTDCGRPGEANPDLDYQCDDVAEESCVAINDNRSVCDLGMLMCRCYLCAKGACVQYECDDCGLGGDVSEPD